jgi:hypothetical protein
MIGIKRLRRRSCSRILGWQNDSYGHCLFTALRHVLSLTIQKDKVSMKYFISLFMVVFFIVSNGVCQAKQIYSVEIQDALKKADTNAGELQKALDAVKGEEREGMEFLIANMPDRDLVSLNAGFLIKNVKFAYQARRKTPWGSSIPKDVFLNNVLPYVNVNERRDDWRQDFYKRFLSRAIEKGSIEKAALDLNKYVFESLGVTYDGVKRPKPDQSPYESIEAKYASCTGLSILLVDALRAVGIPARVVAVMLWRESGGNHTWIEVWDGKWHYLGAEESEAYDQAWFTAKAAEADVENYKNRIYAVSFKKTDVKFTAAWDDEIDYIPAEDVTVSYKKANSVTP